MLQVSIPGSDFFDESTNEFITTKPCVLRLEHSLVSLSKWEIRWKKPFLSRDKKTREELIDYVKCMTMDQNVDPKVYSAISDKLLSKIVAYCEESLTATTISTRNRTPSRNVVTSEVIYYWMVSLGIPFECQKWHLSRLMTLIQVCNEMNSPKQMSKRDIIEQNRKLNAARRKKYGSKG